MKITLIAAAAALALAGTAHAGTYDKTAKMDGKMEAKESPAVTVSGTTLQAGNSRITTIANEQFEVLGVVERNGQTLYQIPAPNGEVFVNHIPRDLTPVTTDVDVVDEFSYEYNGMTFTNRVVSDRAATVG